MMTYLENFTTANGGSEESTEKFGRGRNNPVLVCL